MSRILFTLLLLLLLLPTTLPAADATPERGEKLFNDPALGSNGKSCGSCHPGGRGLDQAFEIPRLDIEINSCISRALQGKALPENSEELQSLLLYIRSLGQK